MRITYPVKASKRTSEHDRPAPAQIVTTIGIFDAAGLWACVAPSGAIELPGDQWELAKAIESAINHAYYQGKADARQAMRDALGLEEED